MKMGRKDLTAGARLLILHSNLYGTYVCHVERQGKIAVLGK